MIRCRGSGWAWARSGEDGFHDLAMDVGQAEVPAGVAVGEPLVVESEEVQDRGVEVVHADGILDGLEPEVVGGTVDRPALDPSAGHPDAEAVVVVIAAELRLAFPV